MPSHIECSHCVPQDCLAHSTWQVTVTTQAPSPTETFSPLTSEPEAQRSLCPGQVTAPGPAADCLTVTRQGVGLGPAARARTPGRRQAASQLESWPGGRGLVQWVPVRPRTFLATTQSRTPWHCGAADGVSPFKLSTESLTPSCIAIRPQNLSIHQRIPGGQSTASESKYNGPGAAPPALARLPVSARSVEVEEVLLHELGPGGIRRVPAGERPLTAGYQRVLSGG